MYIFDSMNSKDALLAYARKPKRLLGTLWVKDPDRAQSCLVRVMKASHKRVVFEAVLHTAIVPLQWDEDLHTFLRYFRFATTSEEVRGVHVGAWLAKRNSTMHDEEAYVQVHTLREYGVDGRYAIPMGAFSKPQGVGESESVKSRPEPSLTWKELSAYRVVQDAERFNVTWLVNALLRWKVGQEAMVSSCAGLNTTLRTLREELETLRAGAMGYVVPSETPVGVPAMERLDSEQVFGSDEEDVY